MTVRAMLNALFAVGSVVLLSGDVLSPCPGPGLAWSLGQMVFTIQWQPQRLTQEDQILDMEDQSEADTAVTSTKVPPASQDSSVWKAAELAVPELEVASATRKVLENIALSIN